MKTVLPSSFRASPWLLIGFGGLVTTLVAGFAPFDFGRTTLPERPGLQLVPETESMEDGDHFEPEVVFLLPAVGENAQPGFQIDAAAVLRAIAEVESRGDPASVGRMGERGLYQFRRATWRQHTRESFSRAHHPAISTAVAQRHYDWIVRELRHHGYEGSAYEIALAWNAGLSRVLSGRVSSRSHHYAQRVVNLASH
jgi:hypothetical protein